MIKWGYVDTKHIICLYIRRYIESAKEYEKKRGKETSHGVNGRPEVARRRCEEVKVVGLYRYVRSFVHFISFYTYVPLDLVYTQQCVCKE